MLDLAVEDNKDVKEVKPTSQFNYNFITIDKVESPLLHSVITSKSLQVTKHELSGILPDLPNMSFEKSNDFLFDLEYVTDFERKNDCRPKSNDRCKF